MTKKKAKSKNSIVKWHPNQLYVETPKKERPRKDGSAK